MAEDLSKRLYVENAEAWKRSVIRKRFIDDELEVKVVERGIILPTRNISFGVFEGGVCDENLNFVAGNYRKYGGGGGGFNILESAYEVDRKDIVQLDEDVIFGGLLAEHFGHFLTESFCRLWYVIEHTELKSKILFVTTLKNGAHRNYTDKFFSLMGIDTERIIYVDKPMQCHSITIPEQAQYDWLRMSKKFLLPYQEIKSRVTPNNHKKLYLTRLGFESKKHGNVHCFNEKYFEDFFAARGFKPVSIEKLDVEEQISLAMGADEIAANIGTLTHWAIFCKPGTKFIMLNRTSNYVTRIQAVINNVSGVDWYIVDASKNFLFADRTHGVCMFGANKYWKAFVLYYFGERLNDDEADKYFKDALPDYVNFWLKKYSDSKEQLANSIKDMCNKIVALEREVDAKRTLLSYQTHVGRKGWGQWKGENQPSNNENQNFDIQAIKIKFTQPFHEIYYSVYYNDKEGWSPEVSTAEMAGTTGKSKSIAGIKIKLDDAGAKDFDILYRVHKFDGTWTSWAKNGEEILSGGVKLNSVQIKLEDKSKALLTTSSMS